MNLTQKYYQDSGLVTCDEGLGDVGWGHAKNKLCLLALLLLQTMDLQVPSCFGLLMRYHSEFPAICGVT